MVCIRVFSSAQTWTCLGTSSVIAKIQGLGALGDMHLDLEKFLAPSLAEPEPQEEQSALEREAIKD